MRDKEAQSALNAWGDSEEDDSDQSETPESKSGGDQGTRLHSPANLNLSDKATLDDDSCPWCLHPAEEFRNPAEEFDFPSDSRDRLGCPNCGCEIPVDAEWYQDGVKQVI